MPFSKPPEPERELGMEVYMTSSKGTGGRLKLLPEDFIVEEISRQLPKVENGRYTIAKIRATNWEMNRLVRQLSKNLGIGRGSIGFAGTKDKRAVTTQLMSFEAPLDAVRAMRVHQVEVLEAYRSSKHLTIGDLIGNRFDVKVRECTLKGDDLKGAILETEAELSANGGFPNFFGVQRFGSVRPITHLVGRSIVKGDLEEAVMWYVGHPHDAEDDEAKEARSRLQKERDFKAAMGYFPQKLTFERTVIGWLAKNPDDHAGALRVLPSNLQMMFVHAYQSYMFNRILSERMRRGLPLNEPLIGDVVLPADKDGLPDHDKHVPVTRENLDLVAKQVKEGRAFVSGVLFGQDSELAKGEMGEIEAKVIEDEGVMPSDFKVPQVPDCNSRGSRRELLCRYEGLRSVPYDDSYEVSFSLGKGCYATVLLREFMKADILDY
ncbi:MAG: tRNA pseudouridine(13) synthase TruD [Methanomassiliicoccales archaeon]|nr:MAG: tRNA pseudouridine(13) synthase TruD [Methanomassiliicoccales archaeon]